MVMNQIGRSGSCSRYRHYGLLGRRRGVANQQQHCSSSTSRVIPLIVLFAVGLLLLLGHAFEQRTYITTNVLLLMQQQLQSLPNTEQPAQHRDKDEAPPDEIGVVVDDHARETPLLRATTVLNIRQQQPQQPPPSSPLLPQQQMINSNTTTAASSSKIVVPEPLLPPESPQQLSRHDDNNDATTGHNNTTSPIVVAYAISLIKCEDYQSSTAGLQDAALVLRHSIHQTSVRHFGSDSRYDYKMYVIVHEQAQHCAAPLRQAGYTVLVRAPPVPTNEIRGDYLRNNIHRERCCGADEFVKLYAYTLPEQLVVHVDIDFIMHRPMDVVFDALLGNRTAQQLVPLQPQQIHGSINTTFWPDTVQAVMTRDWSQIIPGRKPLYQAGFMVLRPNRTVLDEMVAIIREGDYEDSFARTNGWGRAGYGVLVGAMAMQGLLAYYYDMVRPESWMELNPCRFNHLGMDVKFRGPPSWRPGHPDNGKCRNNAETCEDCMVTPLHDIYNIHLAMCRKPWTCIGEGTTNLNNAQNYIPLGQMNLEHCLGLVTLWHTYRTDLERQLQNLTGDTTLTSGQQGSYMTNVFQGHCQDHLKYLPIGGTNETRTRIPELY